MSLVRVASLGDQRVGSLWFSSLHAHAQYRDAVGAVRCADEHRQQRPHKGVEGVDEGVSEILDRVQRELEKALDLVDNWDILQRLVATDRDRNSETHWGQGWDQGQGYCRPEWSSP